MMRRKLSSPIATKHPILSTVNSDLGKPRIHNLQRERVFVADHSFLLVQQLA